MGVLDGKKVFVFDWDGTLLDSMSIKYRTFSSLLATSLAPLIAVAPADLLSKIRDLYQKLSGLPRQRIVMEILTELGVPGQAFEIEAFSTALGKINREELAQAPVFDDAIAFVRRAATRDLTLYVSSSVPQDELRYLVERRLPSDVLSCFVGILGSDEHFSKGSPHFAFIMDETKLDREKLVFFGDDAKDVELCREAGVSCVLVDRGLRLQALKVAYRFEDFSQLLPDLRP